MLSYKHLIDYALSDECMDLSLDDAAERKRTRPDVKYILEHREEEKKKLIKIASGGEMSRIMLAIKNILADVDKVGIMVFDEIDTGISGIAANSVGDKLKSISKNHQVLCVTHLANIAAKGNYNYFISKKVEENRTKTNIKKLTEEETISEIARISNGELTKIAIEHAKELRS